jgi:hypothetical protein
MVEEGDDERREDGCDWIKIGGFLSGFLARGIGMTYEEKPVDEKRPTEC